MDKKPLLLAQRREQLIAEAALQRNAIVQVAKRLHKPLSIADQILVAMCYLKRNPLFSVVGTITLIVVLKPRRIGKLLRVGWIGWPMLRFARFALGGDIEKVLKLLSSLSKKIL